MQPYFTLLLSAAASLAAIAPAACLADEILTVPLPGVLPKIDRSFGRKPLAFEPNVGQVDGEVQFLSRGSGYQLFLTQTEAVMVLDSEATDVGAKRFELQPPSAELPVPGPVPKAPEDWRSPGPGGDATVPLASSVGFPVSHVLRMRLVGADPSPSVRGDVKLPGQVNYFLGNDPSQWRTNVSTFAKVGYREVYPGIDLVYYGNEGRLEYDFVLAPGADPNLIALNFEGADQVELDAQGNLIAWVAGQAVRWQRPVVYQEFAGKRHEVAGSYHLNRGFASYATDATQQIGFQLAAYDRSQPLVIDPVLIYSTYLGGSGGESDNDQPGAMATDTNGNAYVVGYTRSLDFPTRNALQPARQGLSDAFVTKLNPAGEPLFSTYLGGTEYEFANGLAVDAQGNAFVVGRTSSTNFPLLNPTQNAFSAIFLTMLNPDGSAISFSTYLGGTKGETASAIALDPSGNIYVGGSTDSADFPVHKALQPQRSRGSYSDGFVTKFEAGGKSIIYSTYYGGSGFDGIVSIAADADGHAYISGGTSSSDLWVKNANQPFYAGGLGDFFYARILPDGSDLVYASYFGGAGPEGTPSPKLALGPGGSLWLVGRCSWESTGLATPNAFQTDISSDTPSLLARFNAADGYLEAASYLNGTTATSIAIEPTGDVWIGSYSFYANLPLVDPLQPRSRGDFEGFVSKFSSDCSSLLFSTYFGGAGRDEVASLALDPDGNVLVLGGTKSTKLPVVNPLQASLRGTDDAFVAKISFAHVLKVSRVAETLNLTWPTNATGFVLESATTLANGGDWQNVPTPSIEINGQKVNTVGTTNAAAFFRLRKP